MWQSWGMMAPHHGSARWWRCLWEPLSAGQHIPWAPILVCCWGPLLSGCSLSSGFSCVQTEWLLVRVRNIFPCSSGVECLTPPKVVIYLFDIVVVGGRSRFIVCDDLDTLPHLSGVSGVMDEVLYFLSMNTLCSSYGMVQVGSSCSQCHHVTIFKSAMLCFQNWIYLTADPGFLIGPCGDVFHHTNVLHTLLNVCRHSKVSSTKIHNENKDK